LPEVVVTVWEAPPLTLYVKVKGAVPLVPVKVTLGDASFSQTAVVPLIVAVGKGLTVMVEVPLCALEQAVLLASLTLTKL